jgi:sortase B
MEAEDYYITTDFKTDKEFKDYLTEMKNRSIYNFNVKVDEKDSILTLSTCQGYTGNKRLVIHAVKLKEE